MKDENLGLLVHNPPYQGGIVQYCVLLSNSINGKIKQNIVGFKSLYPPMFYKGKLPKINRSGIKFKQKSHNFVTWYNPFSWINAYNFLKKNDVIHLQWVSPLLTPLQYVILKLNKWFAKKPILLTCHNIEPHESTPLDKIFTKAIFSNVTAFVVHAKQNKERLISDYKIKPQNIHIIPHGNFGFFKKWSKETKQELKKEMSYNEEEIILLFFGYIREYKGLRYLLKALPGVLKQNPKVKLLIAGELWQKWDTYEEIIKEYKLQDYVKVIPNYIIDQDVHKYFNVSDIQVLPYYNTEQTISGPLLIGLAFGKPIIISPVGGITELIKDGKNGLLFEVGNIKDLVFKINTLIKNRELQQTLSKNALILNESLSWDKVGKAYLEIYEKMIRRKNK